jgi:hypothetical protein
MLWEHVPAKVRSLWRLHNRKRGTYLVTMTRSAGELTLVAALGCFGGGGLGIARLGGGGLWEEVPPRAFCVCTLQVPPGRQVLPTRGHALLPSGRKTEPTTSPHDKLSNAAAAAPPTPLCLFVGTDSRSSGQDIDVVTGRVAGAGLRPAAPLPPDPQQPPFSPPSVAPASSPVVAPQALAASLMARHEGNGGTSSSTGDLVAAARRLMPPPSSRPQIPAASTGPDADATPKPTSESSRPRSPRQQLPSAHAPSSRSSSNLALPPRPLKSTATPLSRSQPESPRSQQVSSSPVASRFRAQSEAGSPPAVAASPAAAQSRVTSPPQRLASSPVVPRKSFDEPASSRPSLFDLGLVTPRSPGAPVLPHAPSPCARPVFTLSSPRPHTARVVSGCALKTAVSSRSATGAPV